MQCISQEKLCCTIFRVLCGLVQSVVLKTSKLKKLKEKIFLSILCCSDPYMVNANILPFWFVDLIRKKPKILNFSSKRYAFLRLSLQTHCFLGGNCYKAQKHHI